MKKNIDKILNITLIALTGVVICLTPFAFLNKKGDKGETGLPGERGDRGDKGEQGDDGINGKPSINFLFGTTSPKDELGNNGDIYQNTLTNDFYIKEDGKRSKFYNSNGDKGDQGDTGNSGNSGNNGIDAPTAYASTILPSNNGVISLDKGSAKKDEEVVFTFIPDNNYTLYSYSIDGTNYSPDSTYTSGNYKTTIKMKENGLIVGAIFLSTSEVNNLTITIKENESDGIHGSVASSVTSGSKLKAGDKITFTITPITSTTSLSYKVTGININNSSSPITIASNSNDFKALGKGSYEYTYTVTSSDLSNGSLQVEGLFALDQENSYYEANINSDVEGGSISLNKTYYKGGDDMYITVKPLNNYYELDKITYNSGNELTLTDTNTTDSEGNKIYKATMPSNIDSLSLTPLFKVKERTFASETEKTNYFHMVAQNVSTVNGNYTTGKVETDLTNISSIKEGDKITFTLKPNYVETVGQYSTYGIKIGSTTYNLSDLTYDSSTGLYSYTYTLIKSDLTSPNLPIEGLFTLKDEDKLYDMSSKNSASEDYSYSFSPSYITKNSDATLSIPLKDNNKYISSLSIENGGTTTVYSENDLTFDESTNTYSLSFNVSDPSTLLITPTLKSIGSEATIDTTNVTTDGSSSSSGGSICLSSSSLKEGEKASVTITENECYEFSSLTVKDNNNSNNSTNITTYYASDVSISNNGNKNIDIGRIPSTNISISASFSAKSSDSQITTINSNLSSSSFNGDGYSSSTYVSQKFKTAQNAFSYYKSQYNIDLYEVLPTYDLVYDLRNNKIAKRSSYNTSSIHEDVYDVANVITNHARSASEIYNQGFAAILSSEIAEYNFTITNSFDIGEITTFNSNSLNLSFKQNKKESILINLNNYSGSISSKWDFSYTSSTNNLLTVNLINSESTKITDLYVYNRNIEINDGYYSALAVNDNSKVTINGGIIYNYIFNKKTTLYLNNGLIKLFTFTPGYETSKDTSGNTVYNAHGELYLYISSSYNPSTTTKVMDNIPSENKTHLLGVYNMNAKSSSDAYIIAAARMFYGTTSMPTTYYNGVYYAPVVGSN